MMEPISVQDQEGELLELGSLNVNSHDSDLFDTSDETPEQSQENLALTIKKRIKAALRSVQNAAREDVIETNRGYAVSVLEIRTRLTSVDKLLDIGLEVFLTSKQQTSDEENLKIMDISTLRQTEKLVDMICEYAREKLIRDVRSPWVFSCWIKIKLSEWANNLKTFEEALCVSFQGNKDQIRTLKDEVGTIQCKIKRCEEQTEKNEEDNKLHEIQITELKNQIRQLENKGKESKRRIQELEALLEENRQVQRSESAKTDGKMKELGEKMIQIEKMLNQAQPSGGGTP